MPVVFRKVETWYGIREIFSWRDLLTMLKTAMFARRRKVVGQLNNTLGINTESGNRFNEGSTSLPTTSRVTALGDIVNQTQQSLLKSYAAEVERQRVIISNQKSLITQSNEKNSELLKLLRSQRDKVFQLGIEKGSIQVSISFSPLSYIFNVSILRKSSWHCWMHGAVVLLQLRLASQLSVG